MIVGDLAPEVWAFWQGCKDSGEEVIKKAIEIFRSFCPIQSELQELNIYDDKHEKNYDRAIEEGREFWKWSQEVNCSTLSIVERAARMVLVNRVSFSGMGDAGSLSKDNFMKFRFKILERITEAQPTLKKMDIRNCSFEETMSNVNKKDTFIFLDPPYANQEKSGLYGKDGETHHGFPHEHFAEFTKNTDCRWLITYDDSIKVRRMFKGCFIKPFRLTYTMAGKTSENALAGEELFISNYDIVGDTGEDLMNLL